ncbi:hypothetical protein M427DRAFT_137544 [Gonapodya prolifera JEL478]|uniref:Uncharacterized protein n=1 Tax=Gonapodya prolifera (strain JEL478) TaxID=1344416 RepID=A0A139A5P3_GONPJ|nr:hypothetical protein M427DRAFT_137544 [Gonapodya prolifera JEL478]|eukprot:KXS11968.1 hypothetical protein M427DRAFT_137544 [Gonapodya prolifera JEL478]
MASTSTGHAERSSIKTVTTALVAIPPSHSWAPIQAIRMGRDKSYRRWPPHVNILYPFVPRSEFASAATTARDALAQFQPFTVTLNTISSFQHARTATLFLDSAPSDLSSTPLKQINSLLLPHFPHCSDLSSRSDFGFRPHLSLGQVTLPGTQRKARETVERAEEEFSQLWESGHAKGSLEWLVDRVYLIARHESDKAVPFEIVEEILLGRRDAATLQKSVCSWKYLGGSGTDGSVEGEGATGASSSNAKVVDPTHQLGPPSDEDSSSSEPDARPASGSSPRAFLPSFTFDSSSATWSSSSQQHHSPAAPTSLPPTVSLLSWNVLYCTNPQAQLPPADFADPVETDRMAKVAEAIAASGADVVALQEVTQWGTGILLSNPVLRQYHSSHPPTATRPLRGGPLVLSRLPFVHCTVDIGGKEAVGARFSGEATGEGSSSDSALEVWSVHLTSDFRGFMGKKRMAQLHHLTSHHLTPNTPHILAGDFNSDDPSLFALLPRFVDSWRSKHSASDGGWTFDPRGNPLARAVARAVDIPRRYDRVFLEGGVGWGVKSCEVGSAATSDGLWLSDHTPIFTTFDRNAPATPIASTPFDPSDSTSVLSPETLAAFLTENLRIPPTDDTRHAAALDAVRRLVNTALYPAESQAWAVGSFAMGVHSPDSDLDVLAASGESEDAFWAGMRVAVDLGVPGIQVLRFVGEGARVRVVTVLCEGVKCDVSYVCAAEGVIQTLDSAVASSESSSDDLTPLTVPKIPDHLSTSAITALTDALVLPRLFPRESSSLFPNLVRLIKFWAARRGVYSARLGFPGGSAVAVMVAAWLRTGGDPSDLGGFFRKYASWDYLARAIAIQEGSGRTGTGSGRDAANGVSISKDNPPLQVRTPTPPHVNLVRNSTVHTLRVLQEELARAERILSPRVVSDGSWVEVLDALCEDGTTGFLRRFDAFVRIRFGLRRGGNSKRAGSAAVKEGSSDGAQETRSIEDIAAFVEAKLVGLCLALPVGSWARPWPERFEGGKTLLVGIEGGPSAAVAEPLARWLKAEVKTADGFTSSWGDVEAVVVSKTDPSMSWISDLLGDAPAPVTSKGKVGDGERGKVKGRLRPADEIFNRILWDPSLAPLSSWTIGYEDRFAGVQEKLVSEFSREATDETFIPMHRVRYFKRNGQIVWDRALRIDKTGEKDM